jgi:hypothetical protein
MIENIYPFSLRESTFALPYQPLERVSEPRQGSLPLKIMDVLQSLQKELTSALPYQPLEQVSESRQESLALEIMDVLQSLQKELQVEINGYGEVVDYLLEYPDMLNLLPEIGYAIKEKFPDAKLVLEVYKDPEIDCEDLRFYVRYPSYDRELIRRLSKGIWEICKKFSDKIKDKEGFIAIIADYKSA